MGCSESKAAVAAPASKPAPAPRPAAKPAAAPAPAAEKPAVPPPAAKEAAKEQPPASPVNGGAPQAKAQPQPEQNDRSITPPPAAPKPTPPPPAADKPTPVPASAPAPAPAASLSNGNGHQPEKSMRKVGSGRNVRRQSTSHGAVGQPAPKYEPKEVNDWLHFAPKPVEFGDDWDVVNAETLTPWFRGERQKGKRRATHVDWEAPPQPNPDLSAQVAMGLIGDDDDEKAERLAMHHPPVGYNLIRTDKNSYLYVREDEETGTSEHPFTAHYRKLIYDEKLGHATELGEDAGETTVKDLSAVIGVRTYATPAGMQLADGTKADTDVDWNEKFQAIWDKSPITAEGIAAREKEMTELFDEFNAAARKAAVEFVHEMGTTKRNQTRRVGNLLLSFQNSSSNIKRYGSRALACKMFHHERVGYESVLAANLRSLHVPLTCTVKYLASRVTVCAVVPLSNDTQVLGPNDTSISAHKRTYLGAGSQAEQQLRLVAEDFRLAPHRSSLTNTPLIQAGSASNEVHMGADGRLYATQVSRLMPICPAHLVDPKRFRPELVKAYRVGEGLTHYMAMPDDEIEEEMDKYVKQDSILFFTEWLTSENGMKTVGELDELSNVFHHFGVSMNRLYNVYTFIRLNEDIDIEIKASRCYSLRNEMFSRAMKEAIRSAPDISTVFQRFMENPMSLLMPLVLKKFGWNPLAEGLASEDINKEHVLHRVAVMLKSNIETDTDPEGQVAITEVSLNEDELAKKRVKRAVCPHFYAFTEAHKRFRPEILRSLDVNDASTHINADSFSKECLEEDFQRDVGCVDALLYKVLIRKVIPEFASDILRFPPDTQDMLCTLAHQHGINIRLLSNVLFHLNQWKNDGDTFTVKDKSNGNPVALNMVLTELHARTLACWVEDNNMGLTYTQACTNTKAGFQRILDDPMWLSKETMQKFHVVEAAGADLIVPAEKVLQRASALCGALVVMSSPYEVEEVMFQPVVKGYSMPAHLKVNWLVGAAPGDVNPALLPPLEYQLQERSERRVGLSSEDQVPNLALLSVLYEHWNKIELGARADALGDVRQRLVEVLPADSSAATDAHYLLGMHYFELGKSEKAMGPLKQAFKTQAAQGKHTHSGFDAALMVATTLNKDEDPDAEEWFMMAQKAGERLENVPKEKLLVEVRMPLAELLLTEGKNREAVEQLNPVVSWLTKEVERLKKSHRKQDKEKGTERGQSLAKAMENRARARYALDEFDGSIKDFEEALSVYKEYAGVTSDMADIAVCLGQIYQFQGKLESSRENFEIAVSIYSATQGQDEVSVRIILEDHLGPLYQKMNRMSQYHKCRLQLLLDGGVNFNQTPTDAIAMKFFAIAVAYESEKDDEGAIKYFQLSLMAHKQVYGDDHRHTKKCVEWLEHLGGECNWPAVRQMSPRGTSRRPAFVGKSDNMARSVTNSGLPTVNSFRSGFDRSFKSTSSRQRMLSGIPALASRTLDVDDKQGDTNEFQREPQTVRSMLCRGGLGTFRNIQFADTESVDCESEGSSESAE